MALAEVLSEARALPRPQQLLLIQELAASLRQDESQSSFIKPGGEYAIWSPHDSYDAANVLLKLLDAAEGTA